MLVPINQKLNIERYFVLQEKVPDKPSSSYSETLLGLRENATGEPAEPGSTAVTADTANTAALHRYRFQN